jgi:hypothetical protein
MASILGEVRSKGQSRRRPAAPSIREVCLVGIAGTGEDTGTGRSPTRTWAAAGSSRGRVTWSGRAYRVEAALAGADEPRRYVHLAALAEG